MTTSSGELTSQERLELESLRGLWRALVPFIGKFSLALIMSGVAGRDDQPKAREAVDHLMKGVFEDYGPLADAIQAYAGQFGAHRDPVAA